jgi:hypothetical protein
MYILVMLNDFGLLLAQFGYTIVYIWNLEGYMHITNRGVPWKFVSGVDNLVLQALKLHRLQPNQQETPCPAVDGL